MKHSLFTGWKKHLLILAVLFIPLGTYLVVKAQNPLGWDQWGFGSAQTVLTVRHWARDGMIHHKFLFLPSGYHPNIGFLDLPEFRFLADGTKTGEIIGNRLYYTHYPAGYLLPYGILATLGLQDRAGLRVAAILLSLLGLAFFYGFVFLFSKRNHWIAAIATLYYATTTVFLGYADSLANQPIDDLFRNAILLLSFYRFSSVTDERKQKRLRGWIWFLFFLLASSSYDSTFFIFIWLCGLDLIKHGRLRIKHYLGWALAPIAAFAVQVAQNTWYLGVADMLRDFYGAFAFRSSEAPAALKGLPPIVKNTSAALSLTGYLTAFRARFALPLVALLLFASWRIRLVEKQRALLLALLAFAGVVYPFLLPVVGTFGYQGRQLAPALCTFIALATYAFFTQKKSSLGTRALLGLTLAVVWAAHVWAFIGFVNDYPQNVITQTQYEQWTSLATHTEQNDVLLSSALGSAKFFVQAYADRLVLTFDEPERMREEAQNVKQAIGNGRVIVVTSEADDEIVRDLFIDTGSALEKSWEEAGLKGYVFTQMR